MEGIEEAEPTEAALEAIAAADAIFIGPSNPVISIGPILAMSRLREALVAAAAPVIAVSPYVAGKVVKGPPTPSCGAVGRPSTAAGAAGPLRGTARRDRLRSRGPDPPPEGPAVLACPTLMEGASGRRELAERVLEFAVSIG